jgi:hypothetical protein
MERDALIIPAHLPTPHAGRVRTKQDGGIMFQTRA